MQIQINESCIELYIFHFFIYSYLKSNYDRWYEKILLIAVTTLSGKMFGLLVGLLRVDTS